MKRVKYNNLILALVGFVCAAFFRLLLLLLSEVGAAFQRASGDVSL